MSSYNNSYTDASRTQEINALRNAAPQNPWLVRLVSIIEEIHRDQIVERKCRKQVEQELESLKRERLAA